MAEETPELPSRSALRGMLDDLRASMQNMRKTQERVFEVRGTAWSDDRLIKAVVGPRGQLIELDIDPRIYRRPNSKALSASIVATVRQAADDAMRKSQEIMDENMPSDMRIDKAGGFDIRKLMRTHDADLKLEPEEEDDNV